MEMRLTQSMALGHRPSAQEAAVGIAPHILPSTLQGIPNVAVPCPAPTLLPRAVPPPQVTLLPHTDYFYLPLFANKNPSQFFCFPTDTRIFPMCVSSSPGLGQREGRIPDHLMPEEFSRAFPSQVREPPGQCWEYSLGR